MDAHRLGPNESR